ncbi:c-type cytochrome [Sedimentitalea sp. HM32M-2]|uniref:c-type cytochrome n=1 Tax=Sedimentitalea sp. HM32M-2 TaxID=3351566 RepID=UPI003628C3D2
MKKYIAAFAAIAVVAAVAIWMRPPPSHPVPARAEINIPPLNEAETLGKIAFDAKCAACHGEDGLGKDGAGPPFIHKLYEPSHHADYAFQMAVANGVQSHHWPFGNMPPVAGLTQGDVKGIVSYVRALQRANGIQ